MLFLLLFSPAALAAQSELPAEVDLSGVEDLFAELDAAYAPYVEGFSFSRLLEQMLEGGEGFSLDLLWQLISGLLFGEIVSCGGSLRRLLALSLLALLLSAARNSFSGKQVSELARWVVFLLLFSMAATSFLSTLDAARNGIGQIRNLLFALLPVLFPLLAALGGVTTVATLSPALLFALNMLLWALEQLVLPLILACAMLRLVGELAPRFPVGELARLCKDVAMGLLGILTTVFLAVLSLTGVSAVGRDGVLIKAAKTASGAFIPVVGRTLADALDSVLGTVLVLKGAVGLVGGLALLLICAVPACQILAQALLYRLVGALVQPLGDAELARALGGMGQALTLLFAAVAVCGLFSFFALSLVTVLGSAVVMMR